MIKIIKEKRWVTVDLYFFGVRTKRRFYDKVSADRYIDFVSHKVNVATEKISDIEKALLKEIRLYS